MTKNKDKIRVKKDRTRHNSLDKNFPDTLTQENSGFLQDILTGISRSLPAPPGEHNVYRIWDKFLIE